MGLSQNHSAYLLNIVKIIIFSLFYYDHHHQNQEIKSQQTIGKKGNRT